MVSKTDFSDSEFEFTVDNTQLTPERLLPSPWIHPTSALTTSAAAVTVMRVVGTTQTTPNVDALIAGQTVHFDGFCPRAYRTVPGDFCVDTAAHGEIQVINKRILQTFVEKGM
jgi:hypothetical protein